MASAQDKNVPDPDIPAQLAARYAQELEAARQRAMMLRTALAEIADKSVKS